MPANVGGRISTKERLDAAIAAKNAATEERDEADQKVIQKRQELAEYKKKLHEYRGAHGLRDVRYRQVSSQIATVENVGALKGVLHDSISFTSRVFGSAPNPAGSFVASAAGVLNDALRPFTNSGLLGIIPGSTPVGAPPLDPVAATGTSAGLVNSFAEAVHKVSNPVLGGASSVIGSYQLGTDVGNLLQGNNTLRSPIARVGDVFAGGNDQILETASNIRSGYDPDLLEEAAGLDNERLANDLEGYVAADEKVKDTADNLGGASREKIAETEAELAQLEQEKAEAQKEVEDAQKEEAEARMAYLAERTGGIAIEPE